MSWPFISFFGDSTVILPSMAVTLAVLLLRKSTQILAIQWGSLFALTGLLVTFSKLAFMGWGIGIAQLNFTGFSGHAALSTIFWPIFLWLIARAVINPLRTVAAAIGLLLACLIGYSRLVIHAHSTSEVIAGLGLGALACGLFLTLQITFPRDYILPTGFIGIVIVPLLLLNTDVKAPTQSLLGKIAVQIGPLDQVYTRDDMLTHYHQGRCRFLQCFE